MVETRLQVALRHVASAREIVAAQTALVDRLQRAGRDATEELLLLSQLKRTLATFEDNLRRIQQETAPIGAKPTRGRWPQ